jgi:hypothetical protein
MLMIWSADLLVSVLVVTTSGLSLLSYKKGEKKYNKINTSDCHNVYLNTYHWA